MNENVKIHGHVTLNHFNGNGELLHYWEGDNLVTLDGAEILARRFMGDLDDQVRRFTIGYSETTPRNSDTAASMSRLAPNETDISFSGWSKDNLTVTYSFISVSGQHMGTWREAGLVSLSGTLFNRISLPEIDKQDDDYIVGDWKLSF